MEETRCRAFWQYTRTKRKKAAEVSPLFKTFIRFNVRMCVKWPKNNQEITKNCRLVLNRVRLMTGNRLIFGFKFSPKNKNQPPGYPPTPILAIISYVL